MFVVETCSIRMDLGCVCGAVNLHRKTRTRRKVPWIAYRPLNRGRTLGGPGRCGENEPLVPGRKLKGLRRVSCQPEMEPARRCCFGDRGYQVVGLRWGLGFSSPSRREGSASKASRDAARTKSARCASRGNGAKKATGPRGGCVNVEGLPKWANVNSVASVLGFSQRELRWAL